jgi:hypothetical protein
MLAYITTGWEVALRQSPQRGKLWEPCEEKAGKGGYQLFKPISLNYLA